MLGFEIKFKELPSLTFDLHDKQESEIYLEVLKRNYEKSPPIFRDQKNYNEIKFTELCQKLFEKLNWSWDYDCKKLNDFKKMHKNIEEFVEKDHDYHQFDEEIQTLVLEAHFCLHAMEYADPSLPHGPALLIEWWNNDYEPLPEDTLFSVDQKFGDLFLQNPYTGHPPIQCYESNDYSNILRTCAFHDRIKPGIQIEVCPELSNKTFDWVDYKSWWERNASDFVSLHTWEKIKKYTGRPVIGEVRNKELLLKVLEFPELKLEHINF